MDRIKGLPTWFRESGSTGPFSAGEDPPAGSSTMRSFMEKNLHAAASYTKGLLSAETFAAREGLLQGIDPRVRIAGVVALVASSAFTSRTVVLLGVLAGAAALGVLSRLSPLAVARRAWPALLLTLVLVVPVLTGFVSPGARLAGGTVAGIEIVITEEGVATALFFLLRVTTMVSLVTLLFLSTRQADFFKGLGGLPVPGFFTTTLFMTFRYVFILLKITSDTHLALKSRTISGGGAGASRRHLASRMAVLLRRSVATAGEVTLAMASRGFDGRVRTFPAGRLGLGDMVWVGFVSFVFFFTLSL